MSASRSGAALDELTRLPGVGPSIAADLRSLGVRSIKDLARRDPERLYDDLCRKTGERQDPCVLYTFRCAVYAASVPGPEPHLLKWWNWKGRTLVASPPRRKRAAV
jgi:RecG-like helicase